MSVYVQLYVSAGTPFDEAFEGAKRVALALQSSVTWNFNGVDLFASPVTSLEDVERYYTEGLALNREWEKLRRKR